MSGGGHPLEQYRTGTSREPRTLLRGPGSPAEFVESLQPNCYIDLRRLISEDAGGPVPADPVITRGNGPDVNLGRIDGTRICRLYTVSIWAHRV